MKLKEVCQATGLSRKTIRLYEEKGLFTPQKETRNGREYREYTQEDVQTLLVVASLRKAWFTMDEIRRMQQDPAAIQEIFPQYCQWLRAQKAQLDGLLLAAEQIEISQVDSVQALTACMKAQTHRLPLPPADVRPRFRQLDALEDPPRPQSIQALGFQFDNTGFVASWPYMTEAQKWANETKDAVQEDSDLPVRDREPEPEPRWMRLLQAPITAVAFVSFGIASVSALCLTFLWWAWLAFAITGGLWALMAYLRHRREQQVWIQRMGWDQPGRKR